MFQVAPFPLTTFSLLLMNAAQSEKMSILAEGRAWLKTIRAIFSGAAPGALGKPYQPD